MLLAQAVEARVALDAFIAIYGCAFDHRINVDRAHGADVSAIAARDAFIGIDSHGSALVALFTLFERVVTKDPARGIDPAEKHRGPKA